MKKRFAMLAVWLAMTWIVLGTLGCSASFSAGTGTQSSSRASLAQATGIIQSVKMATGITGSTIQDIQPVGVTATYSTSQLKLYCVVSVQNASKSTTITSEWIAVDAKGISPEKNIGELELKDIEGSGNIFFSMNNDNQPFPEGKYRVDVYVNSQQNGSVAFTISATASPGVSVPPGSSSSSAAPAVSLSTSSTKSSTASVTLPSGGASSSIASAPSDANKAEFIAKVTRDPDPKIPASVAVDKQGNLYIGELGQVRKIDANGKFVFKFGSLGEKDGNINAPNGIALDGQGNIFVVDTITHHVQKFDATGKWLMTLGKKGTSMFDNAGDADGEFYQPMFVALDTAGNIYVSDTGNNRVQKFDANGKFLLKWGGALGIGDGQFASPLGIVVDAQGFVYVCDANNSRLQKFDSNGKFLAKFGRGGSGNSEFNLPYGMGLDAQGNIYVTDRGNARVQKFDKNGNYVFQFGGKGKGDGQFDASTGIAVDAQGNIYVADVTNETVQKFRQVVDVVASSAPSVKLPSASSSSSSVPSVSLPLQPSSSSASSSSSSVPSVSLPLQPSSSTASAISAPPGLYATAIQVVQNPAKRGQFITFKVTFLNTMTAPQNYEWLVKPYTPDLKNAKGETYRKPEAIPVGTSELISAEGWRITGGGDCETYIARVFWADPANKSNHIEFTKPDKSGGPTVQFQVCP